MKEDSSTVICAARKEALPTMCARRSREDLRSHIGTAQQFLTNVRMEIKSSFLVYFCTYSFVAISKTCLSLWVAIRWDDRTCILNRPLSGT